MPGMFHSFFNFQFLILNLISMLYDLAIGIYDLLVHLAAPFSRKPRKMMKGHWVVYELLRQQFE